MFATSADVLNLVLSLCLVVLTFFLCWALYYIISSVQGVYKLVKRIELGVTKAEEVIDIAREKLKNSSAYFMILGEIAKKAMEFVRTKRDKKAAKKK
jgi:hypothetical protein